MQRLTPSCASRTPCPPAPLSSLTRSTHCQQAPQQSRCDGGAKAAGTAARCIARQHAAGGYAWAGEQAVSAPPQMVLLAPPGTASTQSQKHTVQPLQHQHHHLQQNLQQRQQHQQHTTPLPSNGTSHVPPPPQHQQQQHHLPATHLKQPPPPQQQQQQQHTDAPRAPRGNGKHQPGSSGGRQRRGGVPLEHLISSCIKQCTSWQQVDAVVCEYGPAFNIIHISAAITHLAQLARQQQQPAAADATQQQQQQQQHGHVGTSSNEQQVLGLDLITRQMERQHQQLQQQLHEAAASLSNPGPQQLEQQQPPQQQQQQQLGLLVGRLLEQAAPRLHQAGSRQVANMLWALSVLCQPHATSATSSSSSSSNSSSTEQMLVARAAQVFGSAEPQHLSNIALAAAKLQLPVDEQWVQQMSAAWLQLVRQQQDNSSSGVSSSRTSSSWGVQPFQDGSTSSSRVVGSSVLGGNGSSRGCFQQQQVGADSSAFVVPVGVDGAESQQVVVLPAGLGDAAEQAAHGKGAAAAETGSHHAASSGALSVAPQATCNFLWSLVQLQHQPQQEWLQEVVAAAAPQLPGWSGRHVAMFMWACARLGYRVAAAQPQQQPLEQHSVASCFLVALQQHAQGFSSRDLSQSLWAAAVMGLRVPHTTLQLLLTAGVTHQLPHQLQQQKRQQQGRQQQQQQPTSRELGHSVSVLLWSVGHLREGAQQLPAASVLQPWVSALMAHAAAAPGQSLGVAAWAAGQLRLTATCPQLLLRLLQTAAHRQQQQQGAVAAAAGDADHLPGGAAAAVLWAAARCVVHAQKQQAPALAAARPGGQQQQQQREARQSAQPAQPVGTHNPRSLQHAIKAAAAGLAQQLAVAQPLQPLQQQQQQQQSTHNEQLSLWQQFALVLWSASAMQLQLPASWWRDQLAQLQAMLQSGVQHQHNHSPTSNSLQAQHHQQQQQELRLARGRAHALAVSVWALGRSRLRVPAASVVQLQQASLACLKQQQQQGVLSQEGCVMLLLGFTHMATTAAAHLPARTALQRCRQHKRYRLLGHKLNKGSGGGVVQQRHRIPIRRQHRRVGADGRLASVDQHAVSNSLQPLKHQQQRPQKRVVAGGAVPTKGSAGQQRRAWWRRHLQQQRARVQWRRVLWQQQRHGWVAATGLQASWLTAYCAYTQPLLARMGPDSVVAVLWALGRLRWHPGSRFMAAAQHRVGQVLPLLQPRHTALLLWSLVRLNHLPDAGLLGALMQAWELQLASASVVDLQQAGWAHKQLQLMMMHCVASLRQARGEGA